MKLTQDEKAMYLLDRLLDGSAMRLDDVQKEFDDAGITGMAEYVILYGAHITREEIEGSRWVYKYDMQRVRIKEDFAAMTLVSKIFALYGFDWAKVPPGTFRRFARTKRMHTRVSEILKEQGVYVIGGVWDKFRIASGGELRAFGKELLPKDRKWIFKEIEDLTEDEPGDIDDDALWAEHGFIFRTRVTEVEFRRCVELINMYETFDEKAIYGVEL